MSLLLSKDAASHIIIITLKIALFQKLGEEFGSN